MSETLDNSDLQNQNIQINADNPSISNDHIENENKPPSIENSQQKTSRKFGTFGFFAYLCPKTLILNNNNNSIIL